MHSADLIAAREGVASYCRRHPEINANVNQILAQIFPHQHAVPSNYFKLSDKEAEAVDAEIERHVKARELKIRAFHDFLAGEDTNALRLPRPDAGRYTTAARKSLMWAGILGADETFRRAATYSLIANMRLDADGYFDRQEETAQ